MRRFKLAELDGDHVVKANVQREIRGEAAEIHAGDLYRHGIEVVISEVAAAREAKLRSRMALWARRVHVIKTSALNVT